MDSKTFDALTRSAVGEAGTRRALVRLLAGGALSGLATRLGLAEDAAAKAKQHQAKAKHKRGPQAERNAHGQLQAAGKSKGKRRGKDKHKDHDKTPQNPPPPPSSLCEHQCPNNGPCVGSNECCPGEKKCPDRESPTGFACLGADDCCPDQKKCAGGCIYRQACCDDDPYPLCDPSEEVICLNGTYECSPRCPNGRPCPDRSCVADGQCCPGERSCGGSICVATGKCCAGEQPCANGSCVAEGQCCPELQCGEGGCCPDGMSCHHGGTCCGIPTGGTYWTCVCASGYTGGCNGQCCKTGCCYPYCC